jgi:hypothetical protein
VLQPLRELGSMVADFSGQMDYCDVQKLFDAITPFGQHRWYWKCHYLADLPDAGCVEFQHEVITVDEHHHLRMTVYFSDHSEMEAAE